MKAAIYDGSSKSDGKYLRMEDIPKPELRNGREPSAARGERRNGAGLGDDRDVNARCMRHATAYNL
jgi:hypothetical protein